MAGRNTTEPPDLSQQSGRSATPSNKRKYREIYDPTTEEQLPDDPWYQVDYEFVTGVTTEGCDELTIPLERYAAIDKAIANLIDQAKEAKKLPSLKRLIVAVLGEQGVGKSTLVNALLDRKLLDKSGDPKACTAFCTMIEHKEGAADDTIMSDVKVEFLKDTEIEAFIKDMVNRWADVHTGTRSSQHQNDSDDDEDESHVEREADNAATSANREKLNGAKTAKEFFEIVYNTEHDQVAKRRLDDRLKNTNIREGDFRNHCLDQAKKRLADIATELHAQDGVSVRSNVLDQNLGQTRSRLKKIWPFVKLVTIATGHALLRYGMCFLDLPGMLIASTFFTWLLM